MQMKQYWIWKFWQKIILSKNEENVAERKTNKLNVMVGWTTKTSLHSSAVLGLNPSLSEFPLEKDLPNGVLNVFKGNEPVRVKRNQGRINKYSGPSGLQC